MENKYENTSSPRRDKYKEEFNKSVNVLGKDNYRHYNESEMNIEESDGKRLYNMSTDVSYEKLTSIVDVSNVYDTIHSDDVDNKEQEANKEKHYAHDAYKTDLKSDNLKCSTGIERRMVTLAGNLASNSNTCTDITYETLASTNDTSNEYDKIQSGIEDHALDRHSSEENTKVYTNMILNATDLNLTESNPDTAKSLEVWTKTESPKALTSEYESLTLQNLSHQDEYKTINGVDREKIRTAFTSRKTRLICIFLVIAILVITTVIVTLVFTVFKHVKDENVEKCVSFIAPENGFIDDKNEKGSLAVGTKITISCREGYFVDGNDTVVCYLNRTWSESPACKIRDCGIPSDIKNGYIDDLENTTVNSTFTVKCDEGYIAEGVETVSCDMNGTWSELPNCRPVSCGIPQVLDNETVIVTNVTTFGATANFRCIEGFSLTSASFATCLSNGSWTQIPSCFKIGAACEEAEVLHDLVRRSRIYQADGVQGSDPFVDDEYLSPNWYSVIFNGKQYVMPDVNTMPQYNFCGTENPIYLKDPIPDVGTLAVTMTVCEKTSSSDCRNMHTIAVRKCRNDNIQYYLSRTSRKSAYCFDPPDIKNITAFEAAPTDATIGTLTVYPELKFRVDNGYEIPYLQFECRENPQVDRSADQNLYSTYWFVDSALMKAYERQSSFEIIDEKDVMDSGYQLDVTIQCGIRVSTSITGFQTKMKSSASFFAGIKIDPLVINMNKDDTATITLRPTVPFGCYAAVGETPTGRCSHTVNMHYADLSNTQCEVGVTDTGSVPVVKYQGSKCGVELEGFYPYQARASSTLVMDSVSMDLTSPYFSDSDPTEYKLFLKTAYRGTHAIWKNVYLSQVQLNIIIQNKYQKKMCYVHVDLHMKTSDGRAYENNDYAGYFILYEHDTGIQVQMKTVACNNDRAYCACAVAVRAGGDVFLINLCGGLRFIDMTSCKDGGALVVQKYSELKYQIAQYVALKAHPLSSVGTALLYGSGGAYVLRDDLIKDIVSEIIRPSPLIIHVAKLTVTCGAQLLKSHDSICPVKKKYYPTLKYMTQKIFYINTVEVQTNIGTLVKINILSGNYKNLINIDIYMAPKDYNRIKGLCGTFDGDTNNDFHDRSGTQVGRTSFLQAWEISSSDINLLEPSCSVNVETWTGSGQLLYCNCNCFNDGQCETLEETATCSPSQYINCTVSLSKTSDLCQDYETRCSIQSTARRSSFYTDPEAEMKRRAALAGQPHKFVGKRQTDESELITEEMARTYCTNNVTTETIEKNQHLLGGFNISQAIEECTWDVHTGQDLGWIATHKQAADSAIEIGYKRDANYTLSHIEELKEFKMQLCPFNCNGNGVCQENGTCTCDSLYFGPDCESNKSNGPVIEDIEGGGFCDQRFGSECRCFSVQTEALAESFQCKMVRQKKMLSGNTLTIGLDSTEGRYRNLYNGECCFAEGRRKRSSDTDTGVLHYLYDISISNDGMNFGPVTIVYVFDSLCLNKDTDSDGNVQFTVKADTCLIDGYCYVQNDVNISNVCFKCDPSNSQYNWTQGCISSPNEDKRILSAPTIAGIVIGVFVGIIILTTIVVVGFKKGCKKSAVNISMEFSSGPVVSREPSRMSFNIDNLTYAQTY